MIVLRHGVAARIGGASLLLVACAWPAPAVDGPGLVVTATAPPPIVSSVAESAAVAPSAAPGQAPTFQGKKVLVGPFDWPDGSRSAIVEEERGPNPETGLKRAPAILFWTAGAAPREWRIGHSPARVVGWATRDLNGDGKKELVLFLDDKQPTPETVWILGDGGSDRLELALQGVHDEASLDAEIGMLGKLGPLEKISAERLLVRLGWATRDELRALLDPAGVSFCQSGGDEKKKCRRVGARGPALQKRVQEQIAYGATLEESLQCAEDGERTLCTQGGRGPFGLRWTFRGRGADRKLVEIEAYDLMN